jgi:hypothetical protein
MGKGTVRTDSDAVATVITGFFSARDHFRKPVSVLQLNDDHGAFAGADAVLVAFVFVDDQKSHSFFHPYLSVIGEKKEIYGTNRKR